MLHMRISLHRQTLFASILFFLATGSLLHAGVNYTLPHLYTERISIRWRDGAYRTDHAQSKIVPTKLVNELISAAKNSQEDKVNLPIKKKWLRENVDLAIPEYEQKVQKSLFEHQKTALRKAFTNYFNKPRCPAIYDLNYSEYSSTFKRSMTVYGRCGTYISISSENPYPIYVPWRVYISGSRRKSCSHRLTKALVKCSGSSATQNRHPHKLLRSFIVNDLIMNELKDSFKSMSKEGLFLKRLQNCQARLFSIPTAVSHSTVSCPPFLCSTHAVVSW